MESWGLSLEHRPGRDARICFLENKIGSLQAELRKTTADLTRERDDVRRLKEALYTLVQYGQKALSRDDSSHIKTCT